MRLLGFAARISLFMSMTAVGITVIQTENMITDRALRLSISAIQVIMAAMLYLLSYIIIQIIRVLHNSNSSRFTQLSDGKHSRQCRSEKSLESMSTMKTTQSQQKATTDRRNDESGENNEKIDTLLKNADGDKVKNPMISSKDRTSIPSIPSEVSNTLNQNIANVINAEENDSETRSIISVSDLNLDDTASTSHSSIHNFSSVVFATQKDLNQYIVRIHMIGLALWQTFLCFDCTARDVDLSFIAGLIMGWYWQYAMSERQSCASLCIAFVFAGLMGVIVLTEENVFSSISFHVSRHDSAWSLVHMYLSTCFLPFATGIFWNIATPIKYSNIILDTQRSIITFLLITITFPLYWTTLDINMLITFLGGLPHISILGILVLSPIFKFISIYIMLISLCKREAFDLVLSLVVVLCLSSWIVVETIQPTLIIRTCLAALLFTAHVINLRCSCCVSLLGVRSNRFQLPC